MISLVIAIATAVVVGVVGLAISAFIGQAILDGIKDVCKDKENEEDSRTIVKNRDTNHNSFLT